MAQEGEQFSRAANIFSWCVCVLKEIIHGIALFSAYPYRHHFLSLYSSYHLYHCLLPNTLGISCLLCSFPYPLHEI